MPGPGGGGGGGRGGGFGGGGGGFHGGGFHGGGFHHHHYHRPFMGGWGWGWGPRFYGGGCLSALFGPFFLVAFLLVYLIGGLFNSGNVQNADQNGLVRDETVFQTYVDDQYARYFSDREDSEDQLVVAILTYEDYYYYDYVVWCGDDIDPRISNMLGVRGALDTVMHTTINASNYKYSLDSDLAQVMRVMADKIAALELESSFTCDTVQGTATAEYVNHTELPMTATTVEKALNYFAETTGISLVLVVEDAADVYEKQDSGINVGRVASIVLLVVLVIVIIILLINKRKKESEDTTDYRNNRYRD